MYNIGTIKFIYKHIQLEAEYEIINADYHEEDDEVGLTKLTMDGVDILPIIVDTEVEEKITKHVEKLVLAKEVDNDLKEV